MSERFEFWLVTVDSHDREPKNVVVKINEAEFFSEFDNSHELMLLKYIKSLGKIKTKKITLKQAQDFAKRALFEALGTIKRIADARNVPGKTSYNGR